MMNVLVTGGNGQLASSIKDLEGQYENLNFIYTDYLDLDITDSEAIASFFNQNNVEYCINCAAYTAVDKAETEENFVYKINSIGAKNLAEVCKQNKTTLIHISTDFVFDGNSPKAYVETDSANPISVYGSTKLKGEQYITKINPKHFILRTSWLYSEHGNNFMKTMLKLAEDREALNIVGDQIGTPTYATDLADVILKIITSKNGNYGLYHYSNEGVASWYDFAKAIFDIKQLKINTYSIKTEAYPTPAKRPIFSVLDKTKIKTLLNIEIPYWRDSLKKAILNLIMNQNLQIAIQASLKAGEVIMKVYDTAFHVELKDDKSPLTEADKKANDVINSFLEPTKIPIISEENKQTDFSERKKWATCWVVDPVDGTKEFIKRNGEFTVNIALVTNGNPVLGVIYVPATKTIYVADVTNKIAFKTVLNSHETSIEDVYNNSIQLEPKEADSNPIQVVGSRSHMSQETLDYVDELKKTGKNVEIVSKGSSLKFCLVAEGNADVYPRFAPTMEWDTAAGQAICNAVGISVISEETKQPLLYNKQNLLNPWFLVSKGN